MSMSSCSSAEITLLELLQANVRELVDCDARITRYRLMQWQRIGSLTVSQLEDSWRFP
jgi:hypothetical protein